MGNEVPKGSPAAQVIAEEERLYGQVQARVALGDEDDGRPQVGAGDLDADLISLRDQIAEARAEDLPPLVEQMTRLAALRARLGGGKQLPVDITSPYFAQIRLRLGDASWTKTTRRRYSGQRWKKRRTAPKRSGSPLV